MRRAALTILVAGLIGGMWWSAYHWAKATRYTSITKTYLGTDLLGGLTANFAAYETWPFDTYVRHQLILSVSTALSQGNQINADAADKVYEIAITASPWTPAIILARLEYLLNNRIDSPEIGPLIEGLKARAKLQHSTWMADAAWAIRNGDGNAAARAIEIGMALPGLTPGGRQRFNDLSDYLVLEE